ncbi:unannotated protein [freshwater metagenome]|uniref:Unannotated protein n=1 Tax=freshwater metagenome TaxID=449393 RepID=A0A6J7C658_9ZZZZ
MAIHTERIAERQRHLTSVSVSDGCSKTERFLGLGAVVEVALHIQHLAGGNGGLIDVGRAQQRRHTEVGVHRPFGVGCDDDDATSGRCVVGGRARSELHPDRTKVVAEHVAQFVVADLADVRRTATETGDTGHGVGGRSTAHLDGASERLVEVDRSLGVDERHRTLHQFVLVDETVVGMTDDVDEGVAHADDVVDRRLGGGR